jgi:DinB superfamily
VSAIPPLAAEDHTCVDCGLSYPDVTVERAVEAIRALPDQVCAAVAAVPAEALRRRPAPDVWSVTEYACHLRDVFTTYTIRLHRTRTEDRPLLEPMLNDLRAARFRYNDWDLPAVLDELAATAAGFRDEIAATPPAAWDWVATRLPGETRTARWMVRQAMHEGVHHLRDIHRVGAAR